MSECFILCFLVLISQIDICLSDIRVLTGVNYCETCEIINSKKSSFFILKHKQKEMEIELQRTIFHSAKAGGDASCGPYIQLSCRNGQEEKRISFNVFFYTAMQHLNRLNITANMRGWVHVSKRVV